MLDKTMPHNIEVEQCVIGSMFLSGQAAKKCTENLNADLFYLEKHKIIYEIAESLVEKNILLDPAVIIDELEKKNLLEKKKYFKAEFLV